MGKSMIECQNCGQTVPRANRCMRCGKPPLDAIDTSAEDRATLNAAARGIKGRAWHNHEDQKQTMLAQIEIFSQKSKGKFPGLKQVFVQPGTRTIVQTDGGQSTVLDPGKYSVTQSSVGEAGRLRSFLDSIKGGHVSFFNVPDTPFAGTFVLPDKECFTHRPGDQDDGDIDGFMDENEDDLQTALRSLAIRTADNLMGGVEVQCEFRVEDPEKLERHLIRTHKSFANWQDDDEFKKTVENERESRSGLRALLSFFAGSKNDKRNPNLPSCRFTLADLYQRIRSQLIQVVSASVRQETSEALYNTHEVRQRVTRDIQEGMSDTFKLYGISLERVTAFRFRCPQYEELLEEKGQVARKQSSVETAREEAEAEKKLRDIQRDEAQHYAGVEGEVERTQAEQDEETQRLKDLHRAQQQERELAIDAHAKGHQRDQRKLDVKQDIDLKFEKAQKALELQMQMQNFQQGQRIKMLQAYADLPEDSRLTIALAENPQLAGAYVAAKRAEGMEERLEMQKNFREELTQVLGKDRGLVNSLMNEAVKQLGQVLSKKAEAERPQIYTEHQLRRLSDGKADDTGDDTTNGK